MGNILKKLLIILAFLPLLLPAQSYYENNGSPNYLLKNGRAVFGRPAPVDSLTYFIMAGQSNLAGRALMADLPEIYDIVYDSALIFNGTNFAYLNPAINNNRFPLAGNQANRFGPEITLSYKSVDYGNKIAMLKFGLDGTSLPNNWNVDLNNNCWDSLVDRYKQATPLLTNRIKNKYFVWYQGEQDARYLTNSNAYYSALTEFIDSVNVLTDTADFLLCRTHADTRASFAPYLDTIRGSQYVAAFNYDNVYLISVDNFDLNYLDTLHLSDTGQVSLGNHLADFVFAEHPVLDSLKIWSDIETGFTYTSGRISTWENDAGSDFVQTVAGNRPTFTNGLVDFNIDYMYSQNLNLDNNYSFQVMIRPDTTAFVPILSGSNVLTGSVSLNNGFDLGYDNRSASNRYIYFRNGTVTNQNSGVGSLSDPATFASKERLLTVTCNQSNNTTTFYLDDKLLRVGTFVDITGITINYFVIGGRTYNTLSLPSSILMKSVLVYNKELTYGDVVQNYYYLKSKL